MRRAARYLAISSKKSICALKKNEIVDGDAALDRLLDVGEAVLQRERELLRGGRPGLADVVAGDRHRMPARHLQRAPLDHVPQQAHRRVDREAPLLLGDVLLEDVGLDRARQLVARDARRLGRDDVVGHRDRRRRVDRHRHRHLAEVDAAEQRLEVVDRVDGDALAPDLAKRHRVIGVVAHQRRHVERRRQTGLAVVEQVVEALVGLLGRAEARELAEGPQAPAVHRRVDPARERILAGQADRRLEVRGEISGRVERLDLLAGERGERGVALGAEGVGGAPLLLRHGRADVSRSH